MAKNPMIAKIDSVLASKGISKQDFYADCKITSSSYSQWNTGKTKPTITSLEKVSEYLNVSAHYLLELYHANEEPVETEAKKENPTKQTLGEVIPNYSDLSPDNQKKVRDFIDALLTVQQTQ